MHRESVSRVTRVEMVVLSILMLFAAICWGNEPTTLTVLLGRVIDGTGSPMIEDGAVVIDGDTILFVGLRSELDVADDAVLIDLDGATILPGFINTHVHNSHSYSTARRWVYEGVTTVRDLGVPWGSVDWNAVGERYDADPRMPLVLWSGPLITVPNGYPIAGSNFSSLAVLSPEDARTQTLALIEQGVDVIKVALAIGHGIPGCLSLEEIEAIVDVAHEHGLRVTAHATTLPAAQRALEAGVDELAHSLGLNLPRREVSGVGD